MQLSSAELVRAALALKLSRVKRATRSYVGDNVDRARSKATSYLVAVGLFAAAGMFVLAAGIVGLAALFRWVELNYGQFWAFGSVGAVLITLALITVGTASAILKARPRPIIPLQSRLRVAIASSPVPEGAKNALKETTTGRFEGVLRHPSSAQKIGAAAVVALLGITLSRRWPR